MFQPRAVSLSDLAKSLTPVLFRCQTSHKCWWRICPWIATWACGMLEQSLDVSALMLLTVFWGTSCLGRRLGTVTCASGNFWVAFITTSFTVSGMSLSLFHDRLLVPVCIRMCWMSVCFILDSSSMAADGVRLQIFVDALSLKSRLMLKCFPFESWRKTISVLLSRGEAFVNVSSVLCRLVWLGVCVCGDIGGLR